MSIETEITRISTNVSNTLSAVSEMGGEVPEGATSDDMASGVRSIPVGAKIDDTTPSTTTTYSSQKIEDELSALNKAKADKAGWTAGKNLVTDADGNVATEDKPEALKNPNKLILTGAVTAEYDGSEAVSVEIPAGGGSSYELPIASATQLGGVKPAAKTDEMTQAVGVDGEGKLWGVPGGGGSAMPTKLVWETLAEGTIPVDTTANSGVDTGLSFSTINQYVAYLVGYECTSNIDIGIGFNKQPSYGQLRITNNRNKGWIVMRKVAEKSYIIDSTDRIGRGKKPYVTGHPNWTWLDNVQSEGYSEIYTYDLSTQDSTNLWVMNQPIVTDEVSWIVMGLAEVFE